MLEVIKEKLRPLFLRKYTASKLGARRAAAAAGMSPEMAQVYASGYGDGWLQGALVATTVKAEDLRPRPAPKNSSKVH